MKTVRSLTFKAMTHLVTSDAAWSPRATAFCAGAVGASVKRATKINRGEASGGPARGGNP